MNKNAMYIRKLNNALRIKKQDDGLRFLGLFEGTSVTEMEEIVYAVSVDANGSVCGRIYHP